VNLADPAQDVGQKEVVGEAEQPDAREVEDDAAGRQDAHHGQDARIHGD